MANRFPLIFNSGAGQIQELAASDNLDLTSSNLVNAGILFTSSGSATAPSMSIGSGTTYPPGLYSPGTDQVAVATNGVERVKFGTAEVVFNDGGTDYDFRIEGDTNANLLFVDASTGRIGIGTNLPNQMLDARGNAQIGQTGENFLNIRSSSGSGQFLFFSESGVADRWLMGSTAANADLVLRSGAYDFLTGNERLRITSAGLVGIGNSSPGAKLDVSGSGNLVRLGDGTNTFDVRFQGPNNWSTQLDTSADKFNIQRNSTSLVTVDSAGRLGIGSTDMPADTNLTVLGNFQSGFYRNVTSGNRGYFLNLGAKTSGGFADGGRITGVVESGDSTGYLMFSTRTGGVITEKAQIDSSGRLLIGTSSSVGSNALSQISGVGSGTRAKLELFHWEAGGGASQLIFSQSRGGSFGSYTAVNSGDELGGLFFQGSNGSAFGTGARIDAVADAAWGSGDHPARLVFSTTVNGGSSPTGRAMIDNRGVLHTFAAAGGDGHLFMTGENAGTTYYLFAGFRSTTAVSGASAVMVFQVFTNGNVQNTNNSYGAISDIKLKENIVDATSQWNDLKALQVRKYNFKEGQTHTQIGLVAQEAELVSPGLVYETPDRDEDGNDLGTVTKSVNYSVLYMKAVKALQEAMERIETLEQRLTAAGID